MEQSEQGDVILALELVFLVTQVDQSASSKHDSCVILPLLRQTTWTSYKYPHLPAIIIANNHKIYKT